MAIKILGQGPSMEGNCNDSSHKGNRVPYEQEDKWKL